jgi:DNA-binding NarL/FixJ family response regulator
VWDPCGGRATNRCGGGSVTEDPLRVYIVDDHPVVRRGLSTLLDSLVGVEVVGEAASGEEAIERVPVAEPDVVVMDLNLPGVNGIDTTRRLVNDAPHLGVLVLTMFEDDESVFAAMRAGARGYVLKGADQDDLARAVLAVGRGEAIFGPSIAQRITRFFANRTASVLPFPDLTDRERQVLELLARGHSNIEVSRYLGVSAKTARNHLSNIFTKLQVTDRANAVIRAREAGLGRANGG